MVRVPVPVTLIGRHLRLDPVVAEDIPALAEILLEPAVYESGYAMRLRPETVAEALVAAREQYLDAPACDGRGQGRVVFVVRLLTDSSLGSAGEVVGTTSLGEAVLAQERVHLGWTLYHPRVWGSVVNPETKYLLLRHCFEDLGLGRVKIQTDAINTRSAAAIGRLGATREGVLRRHSRREDGSFRDTVVFSVIDADWPRVRDGLLARLESGWEDLH
ncbi:MAG: GNAT family N-acetyltransferase [Actinobacteria bacterium]|nr:GNAT family N-acetyltransferase [Actinomycetota bacterium]